ncbi:hypothetical protein FSARC_575 [Fusarium sarcochroum]|uniref:Uncharacterized protein n=1 Tax=Fusarium sarcochroum TaxID=1208366 RepID=A0A8H4UBP1_9HYPO|nr:hypothetical protein FSARC_575 [Fusarium sarcochroum]
MLQHAIDPSIPCIANQKLLRPCAATASEFLFAQGPDIICCRCDSLSVKATFRRHEDNIELLVINSQSSTARGRLVVSYDASRTAIVWDLPNCEEKGRFAFIEDLTAAAWMANNNVALGIYGDGSLYIATLLPLTILHNLTPGQYPSPVSSIIGSEGLSPINNLEWHASSPREGVMILAVQKYNGDLRVWSVSVGKSIHKSPAVIRILNRDEKSVYGSNWIAWSKDGHIIQYFNKQIYSWNVKTRHVTHRRIQTPEPVCGLAVYGPEATLFTVGAIDTAQQFNLEPHGSSVDVLFASVRYPSDVLRPSSRGVEEARGRSETSTATVILCMQLLESDAYAIFCLSHLTRNQGWGSSKESYELVSPVSYVSPGTPTGSLITSHNDSDVEREIGEIYSTEYFPEATTTAYAATVPRHSRNRPSPPKHDSSSPKNPVLDLFQSTRASLRQELCLETRIVGTKDFTDDDPHRQMLRKIFRWNGTVDDLVRNEMGRYPEGTPGRTLLARWLNDADFAFPDTSSGQMTTTDWMLLALGNDRGHGPQQVLRHACIRRLLEIGDLHTAVTMMLAAGHHDKAIEAYILRECYMESLILTSLTSPGNWGRQATIIMRWGEWAQQNGQQQLAMRCFACIDRKQNELCKTTQSDFYAAAHGSHQVLSPSVSSALVQPNRRRSIAKTSVPNEPNQLFAVDDRKTPVTVNGLTSPRTDSDTAQSALWLQTANKSNCHMNLPTRAHGSLPSIPEAPEDTESEAS